jgi:pyruvate/2-oxoacid:ferredoxin oxidoreductase alpha subunit
VAIGSGAETVAATVDALGAAAKVGVASVKLFRPFMSPTSSPLYHELAKRTGTQS